MPARSPCRPAAKLNAGLVRFPVDAAAADMRPDGEAPTARRGEDIRLFGLAWLSGFVFFLAYLS